MDQPLFEVDDAIVVLLGAPSRIPALSGKLNGITRLEKLVFLLEKESEAGKHLTEDPQFRGHHFGPFSSKIYHAVETLEAAGLVSETAKLSGSSEDSWEYANIVGDDAPYSAREFELTEKGQRYFDALRRELPKEAVEEASRLKNQFGALPLRQLVRYVYQRHPKYTHASKIREEIIG